MKINQLIPVKRNFLDECAVAGAVARTNAMVRAREPALAQFVEAVCRLRGAGGQTVVRRIRMSPRDGCHDGHDKDGESVHKQTP